MIATTRGGRPVGTFGLSTRLTVLLGLQACAQHSYGALSPAIRDGLGADAAQMGIIASALYLGTVIAAFGLGGWVDRRSPVRVTLVSAVAIAASLLVIAAAPLLSLVALGYLLVGLSRGAIPPLTDRLGYELAPVSQRGLVFGVKQTGTPLGAVVVGTLLAPIAATSIGWRGAFVVLAGTLLLSYVLVAVSLPPLPTPPPRTVGQPSPADRQDRDVIRLLARRLAAPTLFSFGLGIHQATVVTFLTLYLVDAAGLSAVRAARWFALLSIGGAVGRVAWGWMSDRLFHGNRAIALTTSAVLGGGMSILVGTVPSLLEGATGAAIVALYGSVSQGWVGVSRAWGAELAGPGLSGRAGGILLGSMMLGGLFGPLVFGTIVESRGGYPTAWIVLGITAIVSGFIALWSARNGSGSQAPDVQQVPLPDDRQDRKEDA